MSGSLSAIPRKAVRTATYVVAASNAPAHVKAQADYVCDGTADNVQIQAAIDALTAGRTRKETVKLLGTFTIASTVNIASYTIIDLTEATLNLANTATSSLFSVLGKTRIEIVGGVLDGNKANVTGDYDLISLSSATSHVKITGVEIKNSPRDGIRAYLSPDISIDLCYIHDNGEAGTGGHGMYINRGAVRVSATRTMFTDNNETGLWITNNGAAANSPDTIFISDCYFADNGRSGLYIHDNTWGQYATNIVINNCISHGSVANDGILLIRVKHASLSNLISFENNGDGLVIHDSEDVSVSGGSFYNNGWRGIGLFTDPGHSNTHHTILNIKSFDNAVSGSSDGIYLEGSHITIQGSKIWDSGVGTQNWGIREAAGANDNQIINNEIYGNIAAQIVKVGANTVIEGNLGYVAPGEIRTWSGSLVAGAVGEAVIAWQNPEAQAMMVTGRTRITTGATAAATGDWGKATTVQVVEDCEDAWTDGTHGTCAVNTTYVERGTNCNAITIATGITADDIVAYEDFAALNLSTATHLLFKFRSSVALNAADVRIILDETSACASPDFTLSLPAITANTTTLVCLALNGGAAAGATADATISVGIQVHDATRAVAGTILYIDDVRAITVGTDLVNDADLQSVGIANYDTPIYVGAKNSDDDDCLVMVSAAQATTGLVGTYYITGQGV